MTSVGVDYEALGAGAGQLAVAGGSFGHGAGQVGALPGAAAPDPTATVLLDQVLEALMGSLRKAASELDDISAGLSATAGSYERAEQMLANWHVPGGTTL
jgi:hypothetical protein